MIGLPSEGLRVPSSVIYGMRYDPRRRVLDVVFRGSGEVYRYFGVPRAVWQDFVRAPSKGTYLNTVFKDMGYGYERVEGWAQLAGVAASAEPPGVAKESVAGGNAAGFRDLPDVNVWGFYE